MRQTFNLLIRFFALLTVISFLLALLSFFLKYINKAFISKLPDNKYKRLYQTIMKPLIRYHKQFGFIAFISALIHGSLAFFYRWFSLTGFLALVLMSAIFGLGIYKVYINKRFDVKKFKIHKVFAFLLILVIIMHVTFRW